MTESHRPSTIHDLVAPEGYECVFLDNAEDYEVLRGAGPDTRLAEGWQALPARVLPPDEDQPARRAQLPWLSDDVLALRDEAVAAVGPLLEPFGELLPLSCPDANVVIFRSTTAVDVLDEDGSDIVRFPGSGRIMAIEAYRFRPGVLKPPRAFMLPQMPRGSLYLTGDLVQQIESLGFVGTGFRPLGDA
jgi:hypothetical protein